MPCHHGATSTSKRGNAGLCYRIIIHRGKEHEMRVFLLLAKVPTMLPVP